MPEEKNSDIVEETDDNPGCEKSAGEMALGLEVEKLTLVSSIPMDNEKVSEGFKSGESTRVSEVPTGSKKAPEGETKCRSDDRRDRLKRRCDRLESQIHKRMRQLKIDQKMLEHLRKNLVDLDKEVSVEKDSYRTPLHEKSTVDSDPGYDSKQELDSDSEPLQDLKYDSESDSYP